MNDRDPELATKAVPVIDLLQPSHRLTAVLSGRECPALAFASVRARRPALVEAVPARHVLSIPPMIKIEQVKGFTLYATRAILSGRRDELIDLAVTSVARHLFIGTAEVALRQDGTG